MAFCSNRRCPEQRPSSVAGIASTARCGQLHKVYRTGFRDTPPFRSSQFRPRLDPAFQHEFSPVAELFGQSCRVLLRPSSVDQSVSHQIRKDVRRQSGNRPAFPRVHSCFEKFAATLVRSILVRQEAFSPPDEMRPAYKPGHPEMADHCRTNPG